MLWVAVALAVGLAAGFGIGLRRGLCTLQQHHKVSLAAIAGTIPPSREQYVIQHDQSNGESVTVFAGPDGRQWKQACEAYRSSGEKGTFRFLHNGIERGRT